MTLNKGITVFALCLVAFILQMLFYWPNADANLSASSDNKTMMLITAGTAVFGIAALIGGIVTHVSKNPSRGQKVVNLSVCSYLIAALVLSF